jgi:DNA-binding NtrC family response regulator
VIGTPLSAQSIIETHEQPFLLADRDYRILVVNTALERAFDIPRKTAIGALYHELFSGGPKHSPEIGEICPLQESLDSLEASETTSQIKILGEKSIVCRIRAFPVEAEDKTLYIAVSLTPLSQPRKHSDASMVGQSPLFKQALTRLALVANSETPILLVGESGTGKELAAEYIHQHSPRHHKPFITVDCTVLAEHLFESQLFGHEKGAFTGSTGMRQGLYEVADGGTLFLDEIGEIPLSMQPKLLRALETNSFRRLGSTRTVESNVRIVCATNRDLLEEVERGHFRQDLYFRIAVFQLEMPPLRRRKEDIPLLANHFLQQLDQLSSTEQPYDLTPEAMRLLQEHDFPGNVRELRNLLQLSSTLCPNGSIQPEHIHINSKPRRNRRASDQKGQPVTEAPPTPTNGNQIEAFEANHIINLLNQHKGSRRKVAAIMGISERTLYRKIKKYNL